MSNRYLDEAGEITSKEIGPLFIETREDALRFFKLMGIKEITCLLYTSPSPRDKRQSRMPSSA